MAGSLDVLGPILEMMTWVGFVPGVPLLIIAWVIARRRCQWVTAQGEQFAAGGFLGLQWVDQANEEQKVLLDVAAKDGSIASSAVLVHYDVCHPSRCSLQPPRHDHTILILGWILTGVGIVSTLGGFVLLLL
ncbi:hypothetical protein SAMN04487917_103273 [Arthrobacter sp. yr096]|uniref:hypothetical protein n=1 Tax=unclassified Arthrobacter TaxID=235627 RepID=UPI000897D601|nr:MULTISPECIES: hypothetical protein [unclassified Arthrobacter]SDW57442.1 hypothetical protein SAMN04487912_103415 [Arthrobacter sp. cf158]SEI99939.1 hypothetical protein SAMN04487917_103273 [Arthrobacter sp. yr096]